VTNQTATEVNAEQQLAYSIVLKIQRLVSTLRDEPACRIAYIVQPNEWSALRKHIFTGAEGIITNPSILGIAIVVAHAPFVA
jgi:hypothetical protein